MDQESLEFTVDSQLLGELGERLVTRNYIALSELVKNAYDADATNIVIRFTNAKNGGPKSNNGEIILIDNGYGMTFQQVKDYWMRIATPYKAREPISPSFGRMKTGNKGIGRFACRRLAKRLVLETIAEIPNSSEFEFTRVKFDWNTFIPGTTLTEIPSDYQTKKLDKGSTGLTLRLTDLSESWTESEFNLLRRQLLTLSTVKGTRRKGFKEDPGFEIRFEASEFPKGEGFLVDQFMDAGWGKLDGIIKEDGTVALKLTAKMIGTHDYELPKMFNLLKGIKFEIGWVPIKKEYFRDIQTLTKGIAREVMLEQGGIRVYLDGFRVYPYGDPGDDWLSIDQDVARRLAAVDSIFNAAASKLGIDAGRAMLNHPRNGNLIGRVNISSGPTMPFQVKLDREGFVKNEAFDDLTKAIRLALQWMVLYYNRFLLLHETEALREAEKELRSKLGGIREEKTKISEISKPFGEEKTKISEISKPFGEEKTRKSETPSPLFEKAVNILSMEARRAHEILPEIEKGKSEERVETAAEVIRHSFSRAETYLGILRAVASTGGLMFGFAHEIKGLISRLDTHANTLNRITEKLPKNERDEFMEFAQDLRATRDRFDQQVELFEILAKKTADYQRKEILLKEACTEVLQGFNYLIDHYNIKVNLDIPDSLRTGPMLDAEAFSIIVNLVSNAIKATLAGQGKNIQIQGRKKDGKTVISVFDEGIGLMEDYRDEVFQPLNADPDGRLYKGLHDRVLDEELAALGRGSGLGLNIVRGIAETYGGTAHFVDVKPPWKTCIEVSFA
ncbi:MAG: sensor histidine kinase [Candidatus Methanoperedens sp.]